MTTLPGFTSPAGFGAAAAPSPPAGYKIPGLPIEPQAHSNWCWAAVARAIAKVRRNLDTDQCDIVSGRQGRNSCPPAPPIDEMDVISDVLPAMFGIEADYHGRDFLDQPLAAYQQIRQSILGDRPVAISINWSGGWSAHYVCAYGVNTVNGTPGLWIYDPSRAWISVGNKRFVTLAGMDNYAEDPDAQGQYGRWIEATIPR